MFFVESVKFFCQVNCFPCRLRCLCQLLAHVRVSSLFLSNTKP